MISSLGINASRARSGGGVAHLVGILTEANPTDFGIQEVHVWSYRKLLDALPEQPWLVKHCPAELESSLSRQMLWERFSLPAELNSAGCSILLNVDAGSVCRFKPAVTMSRDMLSYEPGEIERFGFSKARLRLIALRYAQNASLRNADGAIFLTRYAGNIIQGSCGTLANVAYVPHGVGVKFQQVKRTLSWPDNGERKIRCLYISNALPYKHQWHVVDAIAQLRQQGFELELELVGGGEGAAQERLDRQIAQLDPQREFVTQHEFVPQQALPDFLARADLFIFASSCENMPNTLVEAMASGLPIACSNRGPMPEVLEEAGAYFDPENPSSIAKAIEQLITEPEFRQSVATKAKQLSKQYSWKRCAQETWTFINEVAKKNSLKSA